MSVIFGLDEKIEKAIVNICNYIDGKIYLPIKKLIHQHDITFNWGYMKEKLKDYVETEIRGVTGG